MRGFTREAVEALSAARQEPGWVLQKRLEAWDAYEATPMPTLRDEEWRRTDLKGLKMDSVLPFGPVLDEQGIPAEIADVLENAEERGGLFIQHDASTIHADVAERLREQGVIVTDLATAMREHEDLVRPHFMTEAVPANMSKFTALHGAFWSGGTFVYVPKNVTVGLPIHSVYWATTPRLGAFPHTLVVVDAGASLNLVDEYASAESGEQGFAATVVELNVRD